MEKGKTKLLMSATAAVVSGVLSAPAFYQGAVTALQFDEHGRVEAVAERVTSESQVQDETVPGTSSAVDFLNLDKENRQRFKEFWLANNGTCKGNGQCCCSNPKLA